MEGDREVKQKHTCKFCKRSFPCGRSLGGHMRSHISADWSSNAEEKPKPKPQPPLPVMQQSSSSSRGFLGLSGSAGYGLRENPKKTWRTAGVDISFLDSSKGLVLGRVRCRHGKQEEEEEYEHEAEEDEGSWSIGPKPAVMVQKKKSRSKRTPAAATDAEQELEDVALCLMMLSRDCGLWGSGIAPAVAESSDKNSVVLEDKGVTEEVEKENYYSQTGSGLYDSNEELKKIRIVHRAASSSEFKRGRSADTSAAVSGESGKPPSKKSRFQCTTCHKIFHSYQALGGHRAAHKRIKGCSSVQIEDGEDSVETAEVSLLPPPPPAAAAAFADQNNYGSSKKKAIRHQCPICCKVFGSGQALGGHKRNHLILNSGSGAGEDELQQHQKQLLEMPELLDLNLPAPGVEDSSITNGHEGRSRGGTEEATSISGRQRRV